MRFDIGAIKRTTTLYGKRRRLVSTPPKPRLVATEPHERRRASTGVGERLLSDDPIASSRSCFIRASSSVICLSLFYPSRLSRRGWRSPFRTYVPVRRADRALCFPRLVDRSSDPSLRETIFPTLLGSIDASALAISFNTLKSIARSSLLILSVTDDAKTTIAI